MAELGEARYSGREEDGGVVHEARRLTSDAGPCSARPEEVGRRRNGGRRARPAAVKKWTEAATAGVPARWAWRGGRGSRGGAGGSVGWSRGAPAAANRRRLGRLRGGHRGELGLGAAGRGEKGRRERRGAARRRGGL